MWILFWRDSVADLLHGEQEARFCLLPAWRQSNNLLDHVLYIFTDCGERGIDPLLLFLRFISLLKGRDLIYVQDVCDIELYK